MVDTRVPALFDTVYWGSKRFSGHPSTVDTLQSLSLLLLIMHSMLSRVSCLGNACPILENLPLLHNLHGLIIAALPILIV